VSSQVEWLAFEAGHHTPDENSAEAVYGRGDSATSATDHQSGTTHGRKDSDLGAYAMSDVGGPAASSAGMHGNMYAHLDSAGSGMWAGGAGAAYDPAAAHQQQQQWYDQNAPQHQQHAWSEQDRAAYEAQQAHQTNYEMYQAQQQQQYGAQQAPHGAYADAYATDGYAPYEAAQTSSPPLPSAGAQSPQLHHAASTASHYQQR
jgi:hypothetical protein